MSNTRLTAVIRVHGQTSMLWAPRSIGPSLANSQMRRRYASPTISAAVAAVGNYRSGFLNAIDACLKLRPNERPQSVAQVRPMLLGQETRRIPHTARIAEMGNIEGAIKAGRLGKVMDYRGSGVSSLGWLVWRVRVRTTVC